MISFSNVLIQTSGIIVALSIPFYFNFCLLKLEGGFIFPPYEYVFLTIGTSTCVLSFISALGVRVSEVANNQNVLFIKIFKMRNYLTTIMLVFGSMVNLLSIITISYTAIGSDALYIIVPASCLLCGGLCIRRKINKEFKKLPLNP